MWLLNTVTKELHYFNSEEEVPGGYAILSHTWGDDEVSFDDMGAQRAAGKKGYDKIQYTCTQALQDGLTYAWVDTCCIDKRSSAELSEAINSMFRWYANARMCYAYLSDIGRHHDLFHLNDSRWFTRGWTLQELIAPSEVMFFDQEWRPRGDKTQMLGDLHKITRIDEEVLRDRKALRLTSVAKRMSWAADRMTSRVEDRAYSLLGIFDVNMPMLYGEGLKAFQRLQEEIIRTSVTVDHSILAWTPTYLDQNLSSIGTVPSTLLSPSPDGFKHAQDIVSWGLPQPETFELSQVGLTLTARVTRDGTVITGLVSETLYSVALDCRYEHRPSTRIVIRLLQRPRVEELDFGSKTTEHFLPQSHKTRLGLGSPEDWREGDGKVSYDRDWAREGVTGEFVTDDESSVQGPDWTRKRMTLARQPFLFPAHGSRIHVSLSACHLFADEKRYSENDMLRLSPQDGQPGLQGSWHLCTYGGALTRLRVRVMQPNRWTRPPPLFARVGGEASNDDLFTDGETRKYRID